MIPMLALHDMRMVGGLFFIFIILCVGFGIPGFLCILLLEWGNKRGGRIGDTIELLVPIMVWIGGIAFTYAIIKLILTLTHRA